MPHKFHLFVPCSFGGWSWSCKPPQTSQFVSFYVSLYSQHPSKPPHPHFFLFYRHFTTHYSALSIASFFYTGFTLDSVHPSTARIIIYIYFQHTQKSGHQSYFLSSLLFDSFRGHWEPSPAIVTWVSRIQIPRVPKPLPVNIGFTGKIRKNETAIDVVIEVKWYKNKCEQSLYGIQYLCQYWGYSITRPHWK